MYKEAVSDAMKSRENTVYTYGRAFALEINPSEYGLCLNHISY